MSLSRVLSCPVPCLPANPTGLTGQQGYLWRRATPAVWESPLCPLAPSPPAGALLTQAARAEAVVGPRLWLGLVAVEDLLHQLLHGEA